MSRNRKLSAMSLMELLIAFILLGLVVIGISNIEVFCRYNFVSTDRKAKVINDAGYLIEHLTKIVGKAIGHAGDRPVTIGASTAGNTSMFEVWTDTNGSGIKDMGDAQVCYYYTTASHSIQFDDQKALFGAMSASVIKGEIISRNVVYFNVSVNGTFVFANITTCWNPNAPPGNDKSCGTVDNPQASMKARIAMPGVSF